MAYDPYSLCPCGSGKKLKFCCQNIAEEMERINRLIEDNQFRAALKQLEAIDKKQSDNEWITTTRALVLIETNESAAARDVLRPWLTRHPDSDFATVLYALAQLQTEGYDAAKKSIQRAYQKGVKKFSGLVSGLAETVALAMLERRQALAARESLTLALRFASEANRQDIFMRLVEFDNDGEFFYPLRSMHPLPHVEVPAEHDKDYKRAVKLSQIGCWDTAAETFTSLAQKLSDKPELTQAAGLCWAWDGNSSRAAADLHAAAAKLSDSAVAVECELLAQLLDFVESKDLCTLVTQTGNVPSVSRLLSTLDDQPKLVRVPMPPDAGKGAPSGFYQVLDRPALTADDVSKLSLETVPQVLANLAIFDASDAEPAKAVLTGMSGSEFDGALEAVRSAASDQIEWKTDPPEVADDFPREMKIFAWSWSLPPHTPLGRRHELERQQWRKLIDETWPNSPQAALGGRTPRDAAQQPELRIPLTVAVYVLDAVCDQRRHSLDVPAMLNSLGLSPLPKLTLSPDTSPNTLSLMQLHRVNVPELSDAQLLSVVNRALMVHHDAFLQPVLEVLVARPACLEQVDAARVYQTLIDLHFRHGNQPKAIEWVKAAKEKLLQGSTSFEQQWTWDLRELMLRLTDPADPELPPLLKKFASYYGPKIPQMRSYLEAILLEAGVESPWAGGEIITPDLAAAGDTHSVWSPQREPAATGGSKLWLPGQ